MRGVARVLSGAWMLAAAVACSPDGPRSGAWHFDAEGISREATMNYLSRSATMLECMATADSSPEREADLEFIRRTGMKFVGRAICRWGHESQLADTAYLGRARRMAGAVHAIDPEAILQAAVFEAVSRDVERLEVPAWAFEGLGAAPERRRFDYEAMLDPAGKRVDEWGEGISVPDITRFETRLWFLYLIGTYVDLGVEAIHLGQIDLIGMNDPDYAVWFDFMAAVRRAVHPVSRRGWVLFDAHAPRGGVVAGGVSLVDFNSFPMRIREKPGGKPQEADLAAGYLDAIYGRSMACTSPSGWACEALPSLVELDNYGITDHPGRPLPGDYFVYGYDEITWFGLQPADYRREWLRYAWHWVKRTDPACRMQMPGVRFIQPERGRGLPLRACDPSDGIPYGLGLTETIRELWDEE